MESNNESKTFERRYWEELRRRRMADAVGRVALAAEMPDGYERRWRDELSSGLAEAIDGRVKTDWDFEVRLGKIVAEDGQTLEDIVKRGLDEATELAGRDSFYAEFLPQRARHELKEVQDIEAIATGEAGYNTVVTISPYTEELAGNALDNFKLRAANQKPHWQRAMVRVSRWDGERINISTRSIDSSNTVLLKETAKRVLGYEFSALDSTQMLGERIYLNSNEELADKIVDGADAILSERNGGDWRQGRREKLHDTQQYVNSQEAVLKELESAAQRLASQLPVFEEYEKNFRSLLYDYSSLLEENMLSGDAVRPIDNITLAASASGAIARAEGRVYDMCGLVLDGGNSQARLAAQTGFESLQRLSGKKVDCPACKEKVIVSQAKLREGILCCSECKFEVDACTGKVLNKSRTTKSSHTKQEPKKESDWQRIVREDEQKKLRRRLEQQEAEQLRKAA